MSEDAAKELAAAWIADQESSRHGPAGLRVVSIAHDDPELCWRFIEEVHWARASKEVRDLLAAGPLEDLLVYFPDQFFPRVKELAERDERFRALLRGVWLDGDDSPIWREFYVLAGIEAPFPPGWRKDAN